VGVRVSELRREADVSRLFWQGVGSTLGSLMLGVTAASAQVDFSSGPTALEFNFSNPGARSLALAGALTGAGDDATGAWTNPAGLTNITRPEIGVEFRGFDFSTSFVSGGRFNRAPRNIGVDTVAGLVFGSSSERTRSLSFVSAVVPRSRFAFGVYRTQVVNFRSTTSTDGPFFEDPTDPPGVITRAFPTSGALDITVANIGGSVAWRLTDQVSIGAGLSVYDLSLDAESLRYGVFGDVTTPGGFFGPALRTDANVISTERIRGDEHALGVNLGVSVAPHERLRFGASYRPGPGFDLEFKRLNANDEIVVDNVSTLRVPDVFSVGALVKPVGPLNLIVDYRYVRYSQITNGLESGFGADPDHYVVDDGSEIRAAAEFLFINLPAPVSAIALRGGVWHDPDHRIRYDGPFAVDTVLYPKGDSVIHVTGGAGVVFDKVQFDLGFDRSELVTTFAVSAVLRF
jgi:long-chain fatty acid transport protein